MEIAQKVIQKSNNEKNLLVEPNLNSHSLYELTDLNEAVDKADIIVFLVSHDEFKNIKIDESKFILDFCGILKS